jgi:hypothetical protein
VLYISVNPNFSAGSDRGRRHGLGDSSRPAKRECRAALETIFGCAHQQQKAAAR